MRRPSLRWLRSPDDSTLSDETEARGSIANRLRWSYLLSSTLPLLVVGALLLYISLTAQQSNVYTEQKGTALRISRDIARYVAGLQKQLENYGLQVRPSTGSGQLTVAAQNVAARNFPDLISLSVLDEVGREQLRVYQLQVVPENQLQDYSADRSVMAALHEGRTSVSPIALNNDNKQSFFLTLPLRNDAGAIIGSLRAEISADPIVTDLHSAITGTNSYSYLVLSDAGVVLIDDGSPGFTPPFQLERLLALGNGTQEYMGARNQDVIGSLVPITLNETEQLTGWAVVVEQPAAIAFASVRRSALLLTTLIVLVGLLALIWAFQQARRFLHPLDALRDGANALGEGELNYRIAPLGDDEFGALAHTFNSMAGHLQQSLDEIEQQNERLRKGLALARDIQLGLLPTNPPWNGETMAVYARSIPAYEVGGDFYTYLALSEGRAAIAIGDISGKGVGAALIMALTASAVETQGRQLEHPARVLTALNQLLADRLKANHMNAALLFAVFDPHNRTIRIANAGMIAPVLITSEGSQFVDIGGLPVGAFAGAVYEELELEINPGDALLLLSDGVVEAHNSEAELFGFDRLEATIAAAPYGDVRALVEMVLDQVHNHMGNAEQHDDITIMAVRPLITPSGVFLDEEQAIGYAAV